MNRLKARFVLFPFNLTTQKVKFYMLFLAMSVTLLGEM